MGDFLILLHNCYNNPQLAGPAVAFWIALISALMVRNAHIAERSRKIVEEAIYQLPSAMKEDKSQIFGFAKEPKNSKKSKETQTPNKNASLRFKKLWDQNKKFVERYARNCRAILKAIFGLLLFVGALLISLSKILGRFWDCCLMAFTLGSAVCLILCFYKLCREFIEGTDTLKDNDDILSYLYSGFEVESEIETKTTKRTWNIPEFRRGEWLKWIFY